MNILVTGANGFIGSTLVEYLINKKVNVTTLIRNKAVKHAESDSLHNTKVDDLLNLQNKSSICYKKVEKNLTNQDVVVHAAARVHVMNENDKNPLDSFLQMNCKATLALAELAAASGVKRFIFISTINVYGSSSQTGKPLKFDSKASPATPYAISKYEAEKGLMDIAIKTGMEVVIIRSPLVYGAGVPANFQSLLKLVKKQWPLPFGSITENRRSFIGLDNLVDLIYVCSTNEKAANQIFLASDHNDLSCRELFETISLAFGYRVKLLPVPLIIFSILGKVTGKTKTVESLCDSFQVDITHTSETLNWKPPLSVEEGMKKTVAPLKVINGA